MEMLKNKNKEIVILVMSAIIVSMLIPNVALKYILVLTVATLAIMSFIIFKNLFHTIDMYKKKIKKVDREIKYYESLKDEYENMCNMNYEKFFNTQDCDANLHFALGIFELSTTKDISPAYLKKKYKEIIKITHPDNGGSELFAKKVNEAYILLQSFV